MSQPVPVDIPSDSEEEDRRTRALQINTIDLITPPPFPHSKKKQRTDAFSNPSDSAVLIIDDDLTPDKQKLSSMCPALSSGSFIAETPFSSTASIVKCSMRKCSSAALATEQRVVPDTPMSELQKSEVTTVKCNSGVSGCEPTCSLLLNHGCPEKLMEKSESDSRFVQCSSSLCASSSIKLQKKLSKDSVDKMQMPEGCSYPRVSEKDISLAYATNADKANNLETMDRLMAEQDNNEGYKKQKTKAMKPNKISKEERYRLMEEKKRQKERERLLKAESKAEATELKKRQKEMQKWEKGKYALKSIVAEIDRKVVELGSIGGQLLTRFSEKGVSYRVTTNPIERSIVWTMVAPEEISAISSERIKVPYVLIIYEAEEFCNEIVNESLLDHIQGVQRLYPHHTICYLTNRLMAYINKREQAQYKNPASSFGWRRPAIEEVLSKLATDFFKVHSRQCVDEAELAEHVVGLTCSLASCQFRKKLTRLSVNANGSIIPNDCIDKSLIKKNLWLKALIAIPKVQPRFAMAIWKKYPTMKSLLRVYMDPTKSVYEKEFLLKDLILEGLFGDDRRLGEVCSKRIYRILMAQCGSIKTEDVENGADFFSYSSAT
ncbi:crossover junction endonuclease EME1-like isoform X3 [Primulina huaijiensis]|uniref:crossover junction endonuclease EME1-like isoform X3 n=1 Tax=Primulina huaijiensis TaxID=1492673 RepID=UPI003CC70AB4